MIIKTILLLTTGPTAELDGCRLVRRERRGLRGVFGVGGVKKGKGVSVRVCVSWVVRKGRWRRRGLGGGGGGWRCGCKERERDEKREWMRLGEA